MSTQLPVDSTGGLFATLVALVTGILKYFRDRTKDLEAQVKAQDQMIDELRKEMQVNAEKAAEASRIQAEEARAEARQLRETIAMLMNQRQGTP